MLGGQENIPSAGGGKDSGFLGCDVDFNTQFPSNCYQNSKGLVERRSFSLMRWRRSPLGGPMGQGKPNNGCL